MALMKSTASVCYVLPGFWPVVKKMEAKAPNINLLYKDVTPVRMHIHPGGQ